MLIATDPSQSPFYPEFSENAAATDWDVFAHMLKRHRVAALVNASLKQVPQIKIPNELSQKLAHATPSNALKFMQSVDAASRITQTLEQKSIACAVLKGFAVACQYYPRPADREMIDVDLLVAEDRFDEAARVVESFGFERFYPNFALDLKAAETFKYLHNAYSFVRPEDNLQIDLHWRTVKNPHLIPIIDTQWPCMVSECSISGRYIPGLEEAPHALYIIVHGAKSGWARLKWLVDVDRVLRGLSEVEVEDFLRLTHEAGLERLVSASLSLTKQLLGTPLPSNLEKLLRDYPADALVRLAMPMIYGPLRPNRPEIKDWRHYLGRMRHSLALHNRKGYKLAALVRELASPADLEILRLSPKTAWLLAIVSPVLGIWRSLRRPFAK